MEHIILHHTPETRKTIIKKKLLKSWLGQDNVNKFINYQLTINEVHNFFFF